MSDSCDPSDDPFADALDKTLKRGWKSGILSRPALPKVVRADLAAVEAKIREHHSRAAEYREYALRLRLHAHDLRALVSRVMSSPLGEPVGTGGGADAVEARRVLIAEGLLARRFLPATEAEASPASPAKVPSPEEDFLGLLDDGGEG